MVMLHIRLHCITCRCIFSSITSLHSVSCKTINSPFMTNKAPCIHGTQIRINNCSWSFERSRRDSKRLRRDSKRLRMKFKWFTISSIGRYRHIQLCRRVYAANVNSHGARKLHFRSGVLHDLRLNIVALLA